MNLAELQRYFAAAATSGRGPVPGLGDVFRDGAGLAVSERLAIYNRAFFYRQLDALASVFSETQRLLGEAAFERLGLAYLVQHPSEHPAIERVGRHFPAYLAEQPAPLPEPVVDLAALEWARLCALVAPNPAALASLGALDPATFPGSCLKFVPGLSLLELDSRALAAFSRDEPARPPSERCAVAIWRAGARVTQERLEIAEFRALSAAQQGATMAEVCAVFDSGNHDADAQRAFRVVSAWYARSWLERVEFAGP